MSWDLDLEERLRKQYGRSLSVVPPAVDADVPADPIVLEGANGSTFVAVPAETASAGNPYYLSLSGRLVEGDRPNANGAFWTGDALREAERTVAHGPLNWLHEDRRIIGALTASRFVPAPVTAADGAVGPHIEVDATIWTYLWPREAAALEQFSASGQLWLSMECVAKTVTCRGDAGCGETYDYMSVVRSEGVCSHLAERSSVRQLNDPTFLGAAVIVPPARPGWAGAEARILSSDGAASLVERQAASMDRGDAESMVAQIMAYAGLLP